MCLFDVFVTLDVKKIDKKWLFLYFFYALQHLLIFSPLLPISYILDPRQYICRHDICNYALDHIHWKREIQVYFSFVLWLEELSSYLVLWLERLSSHHVVTPLVDLWLALCLTWSYVSLVGPSTPLECGTLTLLFWWLNFNFFFVFGNSP